MRRIGASAYLRALGLLFMSLFATQPIAWGLDEQASEKAMEVVGTAVIHEGSVQGAREAAIANGLAAAVAAATTELLPSDRMIEAFDALNQQIYEKTDRFIATYKVLTESRAGRNYRVMIRATVALDVLDQELSRTAITKPPQIAGRMLVIVTGRSGSQNVVPYGWEINPAFAAADVEQAICEQMRANGFSPIAGTESQASAPFTDRAQALAWASQAQAQMLVMAEAWGLKASLARETGTRSYRSMVTARVFRTDTGNEIAASTQTAVSIDTDDRAGAQATAGVAGQRVAESLRPQIPMVWETHSEPTNLIEIWVDGGGNLSNLVVFRRKINTLTGVKNVQTREIRAGGSTLRVAFQGDGYALAESLNAANFHPFSIQIRDIARDRLSIALTNR